MGIQCRIIRSNDGSIRYVEAPNGESSKLYEQGIIEGLSPEEALEIVLTAYTPAFNREVKVPQITEFRNNLVKRINALPKRVHTVNLQLNNIPHEVDVSKMYMEDENLGNGERLLTFKAPAKPKPVLKAPNGEPSLLNERQYNEVRTPEFMEWSNNWEDVVKDENGEPLVHYHATVVEERFDSFESPQGIFFFTPDADEARRYGNLDTAYRVYVKSPKPFDPTKEIPQDIAGYLRRNIDLIESHINNSFMEPILDDRNSESRRIAKEQGLDWQRMTPLERVHMLLKHSPNNWQILEYPHLVNFMRKKGYTSFNTSEGVGNIAVFTNTQVKSATENRGTFDGTDSNIRFSIGNTAPLVETPTPSIEEARRKNNGYSLDKAPNGKDSKLFQSILNLSQVDGNRAKAEEIKAKVYSDEFIHWFGKWYPFKPDLGISNTEARRQREKLKDVQRKVRNNREYNELEAQIKELDLFLGETYFHDREKHSVAVDENGEPLLLFHGSPIQEKFNAFDRNYIGRKGSGLRERGFYFTTNINVADVYTQEKGHIQSVFLNVRDMAEYNNQGKKWDYFRAPDGNGEVRTIKDIEESHFRGIRNMPKTEGIIYKNIVEVDDGRMYDSTRDLEEGGKDFEGASDFYNKFTGDTYLVFPENLEHGEAHIKSVFNEGAFSNQTTDMRYSQGERGQVSEELLEALVNKLSNTGLAEKVNILSAGEFRQALEQKGHKFRQEMKGFVLDNQVYINKDNAGLDTLIHEYGHLWNSWAKENANDIYRRGIELISSSVGEGYVNKVRMSQPNLEGEALYEEALAQAIGESGENILNKTKKSKFDAWLKSLWDAVKNLVGIATTKGMKQLPTMTLQEFVDSVATDLLRGNKVYSETITPVTTTDISNARRVKVTGNHNLSFVQESDLVNMQELIEGIIERGETVTFWMADQLGRGMYFDGVSGNEHYLDAGISFALDPENRSKNVVWASGLNTTSLQQMIDRTDYFFFVSGSPEAAKRFNKKMIDVLESRIPNLTTFKQELLSKNPPTSLRKIVEQLPDTYEELRNSSLRKNFLNAIESRKGMKTDDAVYLEEQNAFMDYDSMRDGFLKDNNFEQNDIVLVVKPTGIGGKSNHSTYESDILGEVVGVPDRVINGFSLLPAEMRAKYRFSNLSVAQQGKVIAPDAPVPRPIDIVRNSENNIEAAGENSRDIRFSIGENTELTNEINRISNADRAEETGVTLNLDGTVYNTGGLVVPLGSINTTQEELTTEKINEFIQNNSSKISNTDVYKVGLYKFPNSNEVSIDLNIVVNPQFRDVAIEFGRQSGQESLFDLNTFENIKTGADGKNPREYTDSEVRRIADALSRGEVPNLSLAENKTGQTQGFFSDVVTGKSDKFKAKQEWEPILPFKQREQEFKETYDKYQGNFDKHIATSIPTFRETQIKVGTALVNMYSNEDNPLIYDIGGSEGGFVKTITEESNGNISTINLDVNPDMQTSHNKNPVKKSKFVLEAFYEGYTDEDTGITYKRHKPSRKADVVHESMVFQFISPEREQFIREVKENYLKEDGIALFEEKLSTYNNEIWLENERKKDEYKRQYYSQEEMTQKSEEVLVGMKKNQTYREEFLQILKNEFEYVEEYWDAGNFKGYLATNSRQKRDDFLRSLGGRITSEYSENRVEINHPLGFIHIKDNQVVLSNVEEGIQGQGVGTEMYKKAATTLLNEGKTLTSDYNKQGAAGIWNRLEAEGIAETTTLNGRQVSRIKSLPETFDSNGEPSFNEVTKFIQSKNYENQELNQEEVSQLRMAMIGQDVVDSEQFYEKLRNAFMQNGVFNPTMESLTEELYSETEAQRLLNNEDILIQAYDYLQRLKNTEVIENTVDIDENYITLSEGYDSLGFLNKTNPYLNKKQAIEVLGGIKNESDFNREVENTEMYYAKDSFEELSEYTKVDNYTIDGSLRQTNSIDSLRTYMEEVLTTPSNTGLEDNINFLLGLRPEIWNSSFNEVQTILREIEENAIDIGLDLTNLAELAFDKTPTEVSNFLSSIRNFAVVQNETTFEILLDNYINYFDIQSIDNVNTEIIPEQHQGKNLIYLETELDSYTLFTEHSLLPLGNNLYQRINKNKTLDEVIDIIYQHERQGNSILPEEAFRTAIDENGILDREFITNLDNEVYVKRDIENYANRQSNLINRPETIDSNEVKKMVLFKNYFNTEYNNTERTPEINNEIQLISNFPRNAEYLTSDFISDFNKKMIRERRKNSEKYREFYSNFEINDKGIRLINTDPITLNKIQPYLTNDLINHINLQKDGFNFTQYNEINDVDSIEIINRNYYINFPNELPKYQGDYHLDNNRLITNSTSDFIRVNEGLFEFVERIGDQSIYGKLPINNSVYKNYNSNFAEPNIGDTSKFGNTNNSVHANKQIENLYTEKQNEEITNKIDNC